MKEKELPNLRIDMNEIARIASEHFQKPEKVSQVDFERGIKKDLEMGDIELVIREVGFRRRLA